MKKMGWNPEQDVSGNARLVLPRLAVKYLRASRRLAEPNPSALHAFRLKTKRFRYTLELFRSCYGPGFDQRLAALRKIQQHLGDINDCAATRRLLLEMNGSKSAEIVRLASWLEDRMARKTANLLRAMKKHLQNRGQRWWVAFLARPVPERRRAAGMPVTDIRSAGKQGTRQQAATGLIRKSGYKIPAAGSSGSVLSLRWKRLRDQKRKRSR
jgi:hypothetical protein